MVWDYPCSPEVMGSNSCAGKLLGNVYIHDISTTCYSGRVLMSCFLCFWYCVNIEILQSKDFWINLFDYNEAIVTLTVDELDFINTTF